MSIEIKNLVKYYGKNLVVDNLSLKTKDTGIFALLGLNGTGKTTTINILCSVLNKTSGEVNINGYSLDNQSSQIKKILNVSPQESSIDEKLTVYENLDFFASLYRISEKAKVIETILQKFNLSDKAKTKAKKLSGGQKRKLSLALSLITKPKILILDEPTLGLDVISRKELWELINFYKKYMLILFTTHYIEEAEKYADEIAIINKGKIIVQGNKKAIIKYAKTKNFTDAFIKITGGRSYDA